MSYLFEGVIHPTLAAFEKAWPIYQSKTAWLKEGVTTRVEMERRLYAASVAARAASAKAARNGPHNYARTAGTLRERGRYQRRKGAGNAG